MPVPKLRKDAGRNWAFVLYPESVPYNVCADFMLNLHTEGAMSPLHDRDTYSQRDVDTWAARHVDANGVLPDGLTPPVVGSGKKPHYHSILCFPGNKTRVKVLELLSPLGVTHVERVEAKTGYIRYLAHLDDPDKAQYDINKVLPFGGLDLSCLTHMSEQQEINGIVELCDIISGNEITYFCDFVDGAFARDDYQLSSLVVKRSSFFQNYISSFSIKMADVRGYEGAV